MSAVEAEPCAVVREKNNCAAVNTSAVTAFVKATYFPDPVNAEYTCTAAITAVPPLEAAV